MPRRKKISSDEARAACVDEIRDQLIAKRDAILGELRSSNSRMINDDVMHSDALDQAAADTDRSLTQRIRNHDRASLVEIDSALRRIQLGIFGECESCGEEIAEARLRANPATTLCIDCKAELESDRGRFAIRLQA